MFAIDGSKYHLPASNALRLAFDPDSGLDHPGQGHYPQCLVSTAYDVFRRLPVARTVQPMAHANEREEVKTLLPHVPSGGVLLLDRGYPSYELIAYLQRHYVCGRVEMWRGSVSPDATVVHPFRLVVP